MKTKQINYKSQFEDFQGFVSEQTKQEILLKIRNKIKNQFKINKHKNNNNVNFLYRNDNNNII